MEKSSQEMEETKREGKREREERMRRKRERKEDWQLCPLICWCFNGRSSLSQELKPVYSKRTTLLEVGILPPLVISTLRAIWPRFLP